MKKAAIVILVLLNVGLVTALLVSSANPAQAQMVGGGNYLVVSAHIDTNYDGLWITDVVKKKIIVFRYDKVRKQFKAFGPRKIEGDFPKPS